MIMMMTRITKIMLAGDHHYNDDDDDDDDDGKDINDNKLQ